MVSFSRFSPYASSSLWIGVGFFSLHLNFFICVHFPTFSASIFSRMSEPHSNSTTTSSSSSSEVNRDDSAAASSASSQVRQEENATEHVQFQSPGLESMLMNVNFRGLNWGFDDVSGIVRNDTWSCVVVLLSFWLFVSTAMILGVFGSVSLLLGPNSSFLLQPNPLFVQYLKVENLNDSQSGVMLYGTYGTPPLDVVTTWEETRNVSVPYHSHKEWIYYLNKGSQLNISYRLSSESSSIYLVIAQGSESLTQWLEDPTYPNSTFSWNIIHGTDMITQEIYSSSRYYVAVGNLNEDAQNTCGVKLSYGPRWITYIFGVGGITLLIYLAFYVLNKFLFSGEGRPPVVYEETGSQRAPLLSYKDDDHSSCGSSFDSLSHDEEDFDLLTGGSTNVKPFGYGETLDNSRRLCAFCFDAPRNSFFLPCGHCVACFDCASRIAEAAGTCPVCRRNMKKVRKIFTV